MPRMNIAGQVLYNNFTPAAGAKVVIRDLDGIEDDHIFDAT